ncbi:MAG: discoidin domain-containing protein [Acetanaerobacterium sp.]
MIKRILSLALGVILIVTLVLSYRQLKLRDTVVMDPANVTVVKAPDQTEAEENPDFKPEEIVYEVPEGTNIALDAKITMDGSQPGFVAKKAIDANTDAASYWEGKQDAYPNTLTLDFEEMKKIHAIRVCINPNAIWGKRTQTFSVNVSEDGEAFTELVASAAYDFDPATGNYVIINLEAEPETQYIQLEFTANTGAAGGQVAEFEVYSR